jgi:predicted dehydrogenase
MDEFLDRRPDGVVIATPTARHTAGVRAVARSGVPILVEKPIAVSTADLDGLIRDIGSVADRILVGYNLRFLPSSAAMVGAVRSGTYGRPLNATFDAGGHLDAWRPWQAGRAFYSARTAEGGGVLLDLSHEIDAALACFGRPRQVLAVLRRVGDVTEDAEDVAILTLDYGTHLAECRLDYLRLPFSRTHRITCAEGSVEWIQDGAATACTAAGSRDLSPAVAASSSYDAEMAHFVECIRGQARPAATTAESRTLLEVIDAARASADRGSWIAL